MNKMSQTKTKQKPFATVQVDLDGLWTNLGYYGHEAPISPDPVFMSSIPRFIKLFDKYNIKATFFTIAKDLEDPEKAELIRQLHSSGHEIANHTYDHPFGFRSLPIEIQKNQIQKAHQLIKKTIGVDPVGFKAPGYDANAATINLLETLNYQYDSSVIPTWSYPLILKTYAFLTRTKSPSHGPKAIWGLAKNRIYSPNSKKEWKETVRERKIKEFPCTVAPIFRFPIHATFALKLGSPFIIPTLWLTKLLCQDINYEFHAADLSDTVDDKRLAHLKGHPVELRINRIETVLKILTRTHEIIPSKEYINQKSKNKQE
ncbi:polysaccharide deacetylase family protein [archaeon]|jgi:peptidoglycan-N-acetylglucosamine deacetylase|nr:polysaccharide deacetylase family protein [archaeon]MBT6762394.1 polysaccharide deacetylase family protein [archaeon]